MLGPKNKDLKSISDFNSAWADRLALLILAGLAVDIAAVFILGKTWPENALTIAANSLIFIGVWGELRFAKRAREANDSRVAEANRQAAEAQRETERLRRENLNLQAGLRPRRIAMEFSEAKLEKMTEVEKYAGTEVLIQPVPNDFEAATLAQDIAIVVREAGWTPTILGEADGVVSSGFIQEGVRVVTMEESLFANGVRKSNPPKTSDAGGAAQALVALLHEDLGPPQGPPFAVDWVPEYSELAMLFTGKPTPPRGIVIVLVGMRPLTISLPPFSTGLNEPPKL